MVRANRYQGLTNRTAASDIGFALVQLYKMRFLTQFYSKSFTALVKIMANLLVLTILLFGISFPSFIASLSRSRRGFYYFTICLFSSNFVSVGIIILDNHNSRVITRMFPFFCLIISCSSCVTFCYLIIFFHFISIDFIQLVYLRNRSLISFVSFTCFIVYLGKLFYGHV